MPRCARCDKPNPLPSRDGDLRICNYCAAVMRSSGQPCSGCGVVRVVATRDRHGRPRCAQCPVEQTEDPLQTITALITSAEPALDGQTIRNAVTATVGSPMAQQKLAWELQDNPALLTGAAVHGSPRLIALVERLRAAGATRVVMPPCPFCGGAVRLTRVRDGRRCCRPCWEKPRTTTCVRCEVTDHVAGRDPNGYPLCYRCLRRDPVNHEECTGCRQVHLIVRRTDDQRLCRRCFRAPTTTCSVCRRPRPCFFASTTAPICENCANRRRAPVPCTSCGEARRVHARTNDGDPLCGNCTRITEPCDACGKTRRLRGALPDGPRLCRPCYATSPAAVRPCRNCGTRTRPWHHGLCPACARDRRLTDLLTGPDGDLRPEVKPVFDALRATAAHAVLLWLRQPAPQGVLLDLAAADGPVTHEVLDGLRPVGSVQHLRAVLVTAGALPPRDEHLARLEQHVVRIAARVLDPQERRTVRSFASWHHLRRLRRAGRPISYEQLTAARNDIKAAAELTTWLRTRNTTLATCRQADIDEWLDGDHWLRFHARTFLVWATRNGHAAKVVIPTRSQNLTGTVIHADKRWNLIRRLLHDDTIDLGDRVVGLLLLLFAQPLTRIATITTSQIAEQDNELTLALGDIPIRIPPPVDDLLRQLLQRRQGYTALGRTTDNPWLLPGGSAGQHLSSHQLLRRVQALGIRARTARNTTLIELAAQLPAVVLSDLLGVHITTATRWTDRAGSPDAGYAASLVRPAAGAST